MPNNWVNIFKKSFKPLNKPQSLTIAKSVIENDGIIVGEVVKYSKKPEKVKCCQPCALRIKAINKSKIIITNCF